MESAATTETRFYMTGKRHGLRSKMAATFGAICTYTAKGKSDNGIAYYGGELTAEQSARLEAAVAELYKSGEVTVWRDEAPAALDLPAGWTWDNEQRTAATNEALGRTVAGYSTELAIEAAVARS